MSQLLQIEGLHRSFACRWPTVQAATLIREYVEEEPRVLRMHWQDEGGVDVSNRALELSTVDVARCVDLVIRDLEVLEPGPQPFAVGLRVFVERLRSGVDILRALSRLNLSELLDVAVEQKKDGFLLQVLRRIAIVADEVPPPLERTGAAGGAVGELVHIALVDVDARSRGKVVDDVGGV
jgi:hypothetical protein